MTPQLIGVIGLVALLALLVMRIPVAFAMFVVGTVGVGVLNSPQAALSLLANESFSLASNSELIVIPLFILMGNVATESGMSRRLYDGAYAWIGWVRGGLASATVVGSAGFAALSGSSVASALTIGRVSLGEMRRFNYSSRLATGAVAAGGTLGILIPPSTGFVIYAILTRESIGRLFLAGVIPGLVLTVLFMIVIAVLTRWRPALGPPGPVTTWAEKRAATVAAFPVLTIIVITIGGIYFGLFSPVEAAAIGAGLFVLTGFASGRLNVNGLGKALRDSIATTATVMLILIAAHIISPFLALSRIPSSVGEYLIALDSGRYAILALILASYLVLGCFLEGFAMLVLTMPIFFPVVVALGFDPIWFGVIVVLTLEMGLITPPVGINVFIVKSVAPDVSLQDIFIGVAPFLVAMLLTVLLLLAFPQLALFLPNTMIG